MTSRNDPVLYIAARFPTLSETFVYREVLALQKAGWIVHTAGLRAGDDVDAGEALARLADKTVVVYNGWIGILRDAFLESCTSPIRTVQTWCRIVGDALFQKDVPLEKRPALFVQGVAALALARRIRQKGIRHIHAHMAHAPATLAMLVAYQLGVPFSFTGHAADLFRDRVLLNAKLKRAAFVACISLWHRAFYQSVVRREESCYPVVRCGVDPEEFVPATGREVSQKPVILGVGRLVRKKGFDVLLRALKNLRDGQVSFSCDLVGDGPERASLQSLCEELQLKDAVQFHGARSNHEIREMMQNADLFVLPCRVSQSGDRDGIPVVFMEAMASGLCCISGDLPTIRELIRDHETGFLVPPEDVDALTDCMKGILQDGEQRQRMAAAGRIWVRNEFSIQTNVARMQHALWQSAQAKGGDQNE